MASSSKFHVCKSTKIIHVLSKFKCFSYAQNSKKIIHWNSPLIWWIRYTGEICIFNSLSGLLGNAFPHKPLRSIYSVNDWPILGVGQVDAAASSVSGLHLIIPDRAPFHSSPLNYTHDWGKWLTVENVTSFLWYSICLDLTTLWKMDVSGGQLKCLSALQHQVVLVKCKIKCNTIVQLFPIHLELPSNRATHNAFVSGKRWEALIKKKKQKLKCCILTIKGRQQKDSHAVWTECLL